MSTDPQSPRRRGVLQAAAVGAAGALLPLQFVFSQSKPQAASPVLGAPRYALVIGNDRYRDSPLKNPVNDARAITAELQAVDFTVSLLLDASFVAMRQGIDEFNRELARRKAVGLFYFAGHGIQLSWRNYLLPIDTVIETIDEVKNKSVDLGQVLEGMGRAGNPANIVILDACRNNPFGRDFRLEQRGLSQVDAPVGTLLAYATAPGNVAIDGEGANGLYTENLLKEIRVPDAKVEDIFKRVRLAVRRTSKGQQIPWESTSLEDDFYFQLPEELRKIAVAERDRRIAAEREAVRKEEERVRAIEAENQARLRAEAERRRKLEEELRAKQLADAELQRQLKAAQEAAQRAEAELRRKEAEERDAIRRAEAARMKQEDEAREQRRQAEAAVRRRLEEEREAKRRDEAERQRQYEEQLALWERLQSSADLAALEAFVYRYPSGQFTELAQLRIDRLLAQQGERKVEIVNAPENPYTKGTMRADTAFKVGDTYVYRIADRYTGDGARDARQVVTEITDTEVRINDGRTILDLLGNQVQLPDGRRFTARQDQPLEFSVGRRWSTRFTVKRGFGGPGGAGKGAGKGGGGGGEDSEEEGMITEVEFRIVGRERITVPAGTFDCFKVEGRGAGLRGRAQMQNEYDYWMAPDRVRRPIRIETLRRRHAPKGSVTLNSQRYELVSFLQT